MHRGSLAAGDWIQLNGPFNLVNIDSITFRVADAAAGRTAGLAARRRSRSSRTRIDRPDRARPQNLTSTGGTDDLDEPDVPDLAVRHARAVPRFRAVTGGATGGNLFNLNWAEFKGPGIGS